MTGPNVAILFQAIDAPVIDGVRKPKKDSGYADSGADIAAALRAAGVSVVVPEREPDPRRDLDWVFPDTVDGVRGAIERGADTLWLNTIVFEGHPIESVLGTVSMVGQHPSVVHEYDDKWNANSLMRRHHLPVPDACLVALEPLDDTTIVVDELSTQTLADRGLQLPLVVKPLRGRGSKGVAMVDDLDQLRRTADAMLQATVEYDGVVSPKYGSRLIVEAFLPGVETTITVLPPGGADARGTRHPNHWSLPAVERFDQLDGVVPYSGDVPVIANSRPIDPDSPGLHEVLGAAASAAALIGARAPIRVDCRRHEDGTYRMFDINMKPNMTGAGRPGRDDQDSLSCMAAHAYGWTYTDLLLYMLDSAWTTTER